MTTTPDDPYALPDSAFADSAFADSAIADSAIADSAMASGSDAGEPGEHLGPDDLAPDEKGLLEALERDRLPRESAEETFAAVRAAEDEAPLPARGGTQDDGLTPRFSSPGEA